MEGAVSRGTWIALRLATSGSVWALEAQDLSVECQRRGEVRVPVLPVVIARMLHVGVVVLYLLEVRLEFSVLTEEEIFRPAVKVDRRSILSRCGEVEEVVLGTCGFAARDRQEFPHKLGVPLVIAL